MKKGYTLVELIVVIVVLFIIGAITIPIILTKINNSRYEKAKASAYDMIESVKLYHYNKDTLRSLAFPALLNDKMLHCQANKRIRVLKSYICYQLFLPVQAVYSPFPFYHIHPNW